MINITKEQARQFLLYKHGLINNKNYNTKEDILKFVEDFSCIQYDPIDVCGKNHELVLMSRMNDFNKEDVFDLLYKDRKLVDQFDKNMSFCLTKDWSFFDERRQRTILDASLDKRLIETSIKILDIIKEKGAICSKDIDFKEKINWAWAPTSLGRAVLDSLYYQGKIGVAYKKNTIKYYDLIERLVDHKNLTKVQGFVDDFDRFKWAMERRLNAVGLLHQNASYAYIGIHGLKTKGRNEVIKYWFDAGLIVEVSIDGIEKAFIMMKKDKKTLEFILNQKDDWIQERIEFLGPLDNMLWDRQVIQEIFEFEYKWEIYTPLIERKYGYYVLPLLYKDNLVGRVELVRDKEKGKMILKNVWWEKRATDKRKVRSLVIRKVQEFTEKIY